MSNLNKKSFFFSSFKKPKQSCAVCTYVKCHNLPKRPASLLGSCINGNNSVPATSLAYIKQIINVHKCWCWRKWGRSGDDRSQMETFKVQMEEWETKEAAQQSHSCREEMFGWLKRKIKPAGGDSEFRLCLVQNHETNWTCFIKLSSLAFIHRRGAYSACLCIKYCPIWLNCSTFVIKGSSLGRNRSSLLTVLTHYPQRGGEKEELLHSMSYMDSTLYTEGC